MPNLYVATNGLSVWASGNLGDTLARMPTGTGMYSGSHVWALEPHPTDPNEMLAGSNFGIDRWDQAAKKYTRLGLKMDDLQLVTALAYNPQNPKIILAGTQPAQLHRSEDGGETWKKLNAPMALYARGYFEGHWTRVTQILFDKKDPNLVWAGVEIDGAWRSKDGGVTWEEVARDVIPADVHGFGVTYNGTRRLSATTNKGVFWSTDEGTSWEKQPLDSKWQYTRVMVERSDKTGVMFLTNADGPPGTAGVLWRSRDHGKSWEAVPLTPEPESAVYFVAVHPADPMLVFVAATLGQLWRSTDGGETFQPIKRRLSEIRALAWLPGDGDVPTRRA